MRPTLIMLLLACASQAAQATPAYARFPAIRGDNIVFTAEGDLWKVGANGGRAERLTTHPAAETNAALSHDGKWVAFTASYEGGLEAYVMPVSGGVPKRISFGSGGATTVLGWTAQGQVLVAGQHNRGPAPNSVVSSIDPATLAARVFPVADANEAVLSDDGKTLVFTRFGSHTNGDNAKRYRGGAYAQLWRFDVQGKGEAVRMLPKETGNLRQPMWWKGRVYFLSDSSGSFNLWSMNPDGSDARALTRHTEWDVRNASMGDGRIVYQLGADLQRYDLASQADTKLGIDLVSDFDQMRANMVRSPLDQLTNVEMAGKGERVVVTARGHITVAGTGTQRRIDISIPRGARARNAVFSHDDKAIYAIVDTTGENEIWKFPIGVHSDGKPEVLTHNSDVHRWNIYPSPDGKWLAHTDRHGRLSLLDLATKVDAVIDSALGKGVARHDQVVWSPDSKTIAIVRPDSVLDREQIGLIDVAARKLEFVTSDKYASQSPVFSRDGKWLYFLSERSFQLGNGSPWGDRNMGPMFDKRTGLFALALQPGSRFPFKPDDELSTPEAKPEVKAEAKPEAKADAKADAKPDVKEASKALPAIVYPGLLTRLYQLPVPAGNYRELKGDDKRLYFLERDGNEGKATLKTLAISNAAPQAEVFVANVREMDVSRDGKKVFYRAFREGGAGDVMVVDAGAKQQADVSKNKVGLEDWSFSNDPREEWKQMFADAWRMHRDFLFDSKMRGVDWIKMRAKYAPLVERVTDRSELNDVLAMMMSEVGTMHSQVRPGEVRRAAPAGQAAGLGAVLERVANGYRIEHIYRTDPDLPGDRSPLAQPDLDVRDGDVILSVNGSSTAQARDIADLLLNQAGKQVVLRIARGSTAPRAIIVHPVSAGANGNMRYSDWEQDRAAVVQAQSKGKIGYLHLRAMGPNDMAAFAREFYHHVERDGLIIDVRRNRGGNIDSWIIEKLLRKAWAFWGKDEQKILNMQQTFRGHLVVLIDEATYSDGETFAAGVKALKLGPLVGKRTSGAGVFLSDGNRLTDNGQIRVAELTQYGMDGEFLIEGTGVLPDVEVDNLPAATFAGGDAQLDAAIKMLEAKIKQQPILPLTPAPLPPLR
jgi:tricorn protease